MPVRTASEISGVCGITFSGRNPAITKVLGVVWSNANPDISSMVGGGLECSVLSLGYAYSRSTGPFFFSSHGWSSSSTSNRLKRLRNSSVGAGMRFTVAACTSPMHTPGPRGITRNSALPRLGMRIESLLSSSPPSSSSVVLLPSPSSSSRNCRGRGNLSGFRGDLRGAGGVPEVFFL